MWTLLVLAAYSVLEYVVIGALYYVLYGMPAFSDWTTIRAPEYSNAVLWKDKVWYPVAKIGPGNPFGKATLQSFDPESGSSAESKYVVPFPLSGLLAEGDRLWAVTATTVTRIEDDVATEIKTKRLLNRFSQPFIYEDNLAIIDLGKNGPPMLLTFQNGDWTEVDAVVLPSSFASSVVNGKTILVPVPTSSPVRASMLDLQVIADEGRIHLFLSDGAVVAYREGIEFAPVSALAPANGRDFPDFSNLSDWDAVCRVTPGIGPARNHWKAGLIEGEPVVTTIVTSGTNIFSGVTLESYSKTSGTWEKYASVPSAALLELLSASDGQKTYVAGQSIMQILRFQRLTKAGLTPTGALLKAPAVAFQKPLERWALIGAWVYYIGMVVMAIIISRLMAIYRDARYQFGLTTVELASFTRRTIARLIDYFVYVIPMYFVNRAFGMGSQEQVEQNMDRIFDSGPNGFLLRLVTLMMFGLLAALTVLVVNSGLQARWGITLGKWICGIRTVQSTLRPCGFARAMVRELLLPVETLLANFSIPATLLIAFTEKRQRLGDLVADTVVIRAPKKNVAREADQLQAAHPIDAGVAT
jgi:uncharacterized RDD family membrane protein YckC